MDLIQEKTMKTKAISVKRNYIRGKTILYAAICFQIFLMGFSLCSLFLFSWENVYFRADRWIYSVLMCFVREGEIKQPQLLQLPQDVSWTGLFHFQHVRVVWCWPSWCQQCSLAHLLLLCSPDTALLYQSILISQLTPEANLQKNYKPQKLLLKG